MMQMNGGHWNAVRTSLNPHYVFGLPIFLTLLFELDKPILYKLLECLYRIGTFFSPLMPAMGVVKLFILFYVEKVCCQTIMFQWY